VRVFFRKEGQLGAIGSVAWMFDRLGQIEATHKDGKIDSEGAAIEAGAQDVEPLDASEVETGHVGAVFYTDPGDLDVVNKQLTESGWTVSKSEIGYRAKNFVELTPEARKEVEEFLSKIDDNDDVHRVYAGIK